jgi:hypothetical protein
VLRLKLNERRADTAAVAATARLPRRVWVALEVTAALAVCFTVGSSLANGATRPTSALTGSISVTCSLGQCGQFFGWKCDMPVDLDSLYVNVDASPGPDAVQLSGGCTGVIRHIEIHTVAGDGIKVSGGGGPSNLVIGSGTTPGDGGSVSCTGREPVKHQDGIQVLGGHSVTFLALNVACTTANNAQFFVNTTSQNPGDATDVIFDRGRLQPGTGYHDVTIGVSTRSGVTNSIVCPSRTTALTYDTTQASDPVNLNNTFPASC